MTAALPLLQAIGLLGGITGAALVAGSTSRQRATGFTCWIAGNSAWVGYAALTGALALGIQFSVFLLLAVAGLLNNRPQEIPDDGTEARSTGWSYD